MEPEYAYSLPSSQKHIVVPYPEPHEFSPYFHILQPRYILTSSAPDLSNLFPTRFL